MNVLRSLAIAFTMYSRIPAPRVKWEKEAMSLALCFFPLVGAVIGALLCAWWYVAGLIS
ncbi:MAG: adenosylcobinamide-GDP ribazoletransferase, partial [Oscillospiraceae bacterium]|nr:adenosylcobinamide-GDP ribazoletransferase [Oscillospiraceae bacterium]